MRDFARRASQVSFALLGLLCASPALRAQATTSLRGTVSDSTNAVIPEAAVTLTGKGTGFTRSAVTNASGEYQFSQVPPGEYTLTTEKPGFAVSVDNGVKLLVNSPATLDVRLEIGKTSETVAITAEAPPINTTNASVGNNFTEKQIRQLPLLTRNVVELLSLQPGVTATGEVLGARRDQNNVTLDGVDVNDNQDAGIGGSVNDGQGSNANGATPRSGFNSVLPIPLDSVQEFRVTVAGQDANEGRSSGGQVALVTKSGTNTFHGSAYEFNRNTATAANTWFNNRSGVPREQLVRNQFGASLGGRIIRDRLFLFLNYERRLDSSAAAQERSVPSEALKQGVLTVTTTDGGTYTLGPAALQKIDPLGIGINSQVLGIMKSYPTGNDAPYGADSGDNFSGFRFNAPDKLDNRAYVGKMDYVIDRASHNTLSVRGTLGNSSQDNLNALAQFPGQQSASKLLDNSKGLSALLTSVVTPNLVNAFNFGYTRQGIQQSGVNGAAFTFTDVSSLANYNARASGRILPVYNLVDDVTWTHGKHTITTGFNFRLITNNRYTYGQSFPSFGFSSTLAVGLGEDIQTSVIDYLQQQTGNSSLALASPDAVANAMGILLGAVNYTNITYQFLRNGSVLPQGQAQKREFSLNEYEGYVADSWRVSRGLTVTAGLRYSNNRPPYETSGLQVSPTVGLDQFFAQRNGEQAVGIPGNAQSLAVIQYALNGPVNHKPTWYGADNKDFAPRFSFAYSPKENTGWLHKIFGDNGVFRGGYALVYDRFGSELITQFDQFGSLGLATTLGNATSYTFSTAPRYDGSAAVQPPAPQGGFPYSPPDIAAIVGSFQGIYPDLKSPYAHLLNASFARQLPFGLTMEVGYVGRLSHKLLLQGDVYTPLEHFKDPKSGETWIQSMTALRQAYDKGITPNQVQSNPGLIATNPFVEDMFPSLANYYIPGSASANYFYGIYGVYGGSYLDILHVVDRVPDAFGTGAGTCASRTGCYTFFARQGSSMPTWMNAGNAAFHAGTLTIRRAFQHGFQFDFNYTLSHSIDNASAAEGGAGQFGATIQNIFAPGEFRGSSDFDVRHNITADFVYELPFGKGKMLLNTSSRWLNQVVGGWQLSSILRYASGLPSIVQGNYTWNTNYWQNSLAIPAGTFHQKLGIDAGGNPGLFADVSAANSFVDQYPGQTGSRALLRLASTKNVDLALAKSFQLPFEGQRLQFRAEAFNAFNLVNFIQPSLALYSPSTFGEFTATTPPRTMQFALRYEF